MTAFNVVRFRVKPGRDQEFIAAHRNVTVDGFTGSRRFTLVKTGDNSYCVIGEWDSFDSIVAARSPMISLLDGFRDCLEDLGGSLGVTDPVSGETIIDMSAKPRRATGAKRKAAKRAKPRAKAKAATKTKARKPAKRAAKKRAARAIRRR